METTVLGRTGLRVSRMGIGAGGPSQIGKRTGLSEEESVDLLRRAFDAGVNLVDSSENYGTEPIIGRALIGRDRSSVVLSTKKSTRRQQVSERTLSASLDASLRALGTDYIDIYNLHGVVPEDYTRLVTDIYPTLERAREAGKIRFLGITEMYNEDLDHTMMERALRDDLWDVVMVGFSLLNQTARKRLLPLARKHNVGVQVMFAVRKALSSAEHFAQFVKHLIGTGELDEKDGDRCLGDDFIKHLGAESLTDASYRFCRDEPGVHVVLSGTGNRQHLQQNLASFERGPLSTAAIERLHAVFTRVRSTTGQSLP
jgi:L-galactose dehydrogenase